MDDSSHKDSEQKKEDVLKRVNDSMKISEKDIVDIEDTTFRAEMHLEKPKVTDRDPTHERDVGNDMQHKKV